MSTETAVAEPATEAPMTPVGDVYAAALAKAEKGEETPVAEPTATPEATPEAAPEKTEPEAPTKPQTALEAALAEQKPAEETKGADDPLKDVPEVLPNEGRKDHWAKARAAIKTQSERAAKAEQLAQEYQAKVEASKSAPPETVAELERAKAQIAELTDAITAANVELLPEFRTKFIDGAKALVAKATEKAKAYGGNPEALMEALAMPEGKRRDAAIEEALGEDANDMARSKVNAIVAQLDDLNEQAQNERANAQQSYERLTQKQQEQRLAQQQEIEGRKKQTFETVTKKLQAEVSTLRTVDPSIPGAEDWNNGVQAAYTKAEKLFGPDVAPEETVATAIKGSDYDRVVGLLTTSWAESAQLKKQLAELEGAQPDVRGGKAPMKTGVEAVLDKTPGQLFAESMAAQTNRED